MTSYPETYRLVDHHGQPQTHRANDSLDNGYYPPQYDPSLGHGLNPPALAHGERWASASNVNIPMTSMDSRATLVRTPSPTPSEIEALEDTGIGLMNTKAMKSKEFWMSKKGIIYGIAIAVGVTVGILFAVYHKSIVKWLTPATQWAHDTNFGWLIPVAILIILSFPPLFGHELVGLLCGVAWGIGEGFAIVALGTLLGEIANYYTFKYWCTARAGKYEKKKIGYACLARVVREGGFLMAVAIRLSLIPPHLTTTVFATAGMSITTFIGAAILSLPKQLATVYLGVLLGESVDGTSRKDTIASVAVTVVSAVITTVALRYVRKEINRVKPQVMYERRKARLAANLKTLSHDSSIASSV